MDEDQESDQVEWKKVFEEDREFNQGGCRRCHCLLISAAAAAAAAAAEAAAEGAGSSS